MREEVSRGGPRRAWLGVAVDALLAGLLALLGWEPVFSFVAAHRHHAALALGVLHTLLVPVALLVGTMRSEELGIVHEKHFFDRVTAAAFVGFYVMGWVMPLMAISSASSLAFLVFPCIGAHVLPIFLAFLSVIPGLGRFIDRAALGLSSRPVVAALAVLFCVYMALIESFLLLLRAGGRGASDLVFPAWALSYLPARLFLARLTGMRGPEVWSFGASNVHLLVRLLLAR